MEEIALKIRKAREAKGWSQSDLAGSAGVSQQTIAKIESGTTSRSRHMADIASALEIDIEELGIFGSLVGKEIRAVLMPSGAALAADPTKPIPVYTTSPSSNGQVWRPQTPIERITRPSVIGTSKGYGLYLVEIEMQPVFDPGDIVVIHESLPPMPGTYCLFLTSEDVTKDNMAAVRKLISIEDDGWMVQQFNPPRQYKIAEKEWPVAKRVVGRFMRN